jgi:hypothetical protein
MQPNFDFGSMLIGAGIILTLFGSMLGVLMVVRQIGRGKPKP